MNTATGDHFPNSSMDGQDKPAVIPSDDTTRTQPEPMSERTTVGSEALVNVVKIAKVNSQIDQLYEKYQKSKKEVEDHQERASRKVYMVLQHTAPLPDAPSSNMPPPPPPL